MIKFSEFSMDEMARKNPSQNPRIPAYNQMIDKGYDTKDYFFTFTNLKKVGINPTSRYDTPNGIYCFPAKEILEQVHGNMKNVPYVSKAPYIYVLKKKKKGIIDPMESYSQSDYKRDMKKIYKLITETKKGRLLMNDEGKKVVREIMFAAQGDSKQSTPIAWLWNVTRELSADAYISTLMDWGGVRDTKTRDWYSIDTVMNYDFKADKYRKCKKKKERNPEYSRRGGVSTNSQGWNNLLRQLGYELFVDRSGSGLIHSNEPTQAVFLSVKAFEVVDMIENKSYEAIYQQQHINDYIKVLEKKHNTVSVVGQLGKSDLNQLRFLSEGDIRGCHIDYHDRLFYISGGGEISNFDFFGDSVRLSDITIDSGSCKYMKYIVECVLMGGDFIDCELESCEVLGGEYTECDFPKTPVLNNVRLFGCEKLTNHAFLNCYFEQCRTYDCSFGSGCVVNNSYLTGKKGRIVLDGAVAYMKCNIINATILDGLFEEFRIEKSIIKGGDFDKGRINYSVVKDGQFRDTIFHESDVQGGKKV